MLCMNAYPAAYVDACRTRMTEQLAAWARLRPCVKDAATLEAFAAPFFNHLVIVLDSCFMHRSRTLELKDGNPMNEVRMLAASILQHGAVLTADSGIKYEPATAVLGLAIGDRIALSEPQFRKLSDAYFAAITRTFA